ncbi:hypothetical protein DXG01_008103, partial [Tephrocybe rancida]
GELEHRHVKKFYARTNKNNAVRQMTKLERHERVLEQQSMTNKLRKKRGLTATPHIDFFQSEPLPPTPPEVHHYISPSQNSYLDIPTWLSANSGDPAVEDFLPKLKDHLLSRILHPDWSGDGNEFTPEQHYRLLIRNDRLYIHKSAPTSIEFLWVRWYQRDPTYCAGFKRKRLHRLQYLLDSDPEAYRFLNPDEVIRGAHIIPGFYYGPTEEFAPSVAHATDELDDWVYYYVDFFVDRDMYWGPLPEEPLDYNKALLDEEDWQLAAKNNSAGTGGSIPQSEDNSRQNSDTDEGDGSDSSSDDDGDEWRGDEDSDEDLGPDDGEGGYDNEDELGYAPL